MLCMLPFSLHPILLASNSSNWNMSRNFRDPRAPNTIPPALTWPFFLVTQSSNTERHVAFKNSSEKPTLFVRLRTNNKQSSTISREYPEIIYRDEITRVRARKVTIRSSGNPIGSFYRLGVTINLSRRFYGASWKIMVVPDVPHRRMHPSTGQTHCRWTDGNHDQLTHNAVNGRVCAQGVAHLVHRGCPLISEKSMPSHSCTPTGRPHDCLWIRKHAYTRLCCAWNIIENES